MILYVLWIGGLLLIAQGALAAQHESPVNKTVIQISTDDARIRAIALNNPVNG